MADTTDKLTPKQQVDAFVEFCDGVIARWDAMIAKREQDDRELIQLLKSAQVSTEQTIKAVRMAQANLTE